jgi:peptide deformylase
MSATKENIIQLPNKHLRQTSKKVGLITPAIKDLIKDMVLATLDWEESREHEVGVALAAIQIDKPLRVVILRDDFSDKTNKKFNVFINPEITKYEGNIEEDHEGCLSIKDIYGLVPRHDKVRVKALNEKGQEVRLKAEGFLARVFQHEIDHTKGKTFIDYIKEKPDNFFKIDAEGQLEPIDYIKYIKNNKDLWN